MNKNTKKILIIIGVVIVLGIVYISFFGGDSKAKSSSAISSSSKSKVVPKATSDKTKANSDTAFLSTLLGLSSIKVDDTMFESASFLSLVDNNVPIVGDGVTGRPNPFAPFDAPVQAEADSEAPVVTMEASQITKDSALLTGSLASGVKAQSRFFQWGTTESLGQKTEVAPESLVGTFTKTLTGLKSQTTYYFQAVIIVDKATIKGDIISFKTN